ncbi:6810_t:CDS:2 [Ambispora leptoticha]|uniref:Glucose-6-phosphate 1-epimerase n=1 Tax=Ambispora leptoticha TaxID=144679 RepID=A0A9N8W335_9GLOM|nr:6810_t:CDS:2 [Ambispora leptoticha]
MSVQNLENKVILTHGSGSSAEVYLFGATVTSWKVSGLERLFLSKKAILDGTKAIRGGIPLVFPQFGTAKNPNDASAKLPQHGIARISTWEILSTTSGTSVSNGDEEVTATFGLTDSQISNNLREAWPKKFQLIYTVSLTARTLKTSLEVKNEDNEPFNFHVLFHTYFSVPDISKVSILGLSNLTYTDKVLNGTRALESREKITIDQEVDRVYENVASDEIVVDLQEGKGNFHVKPSNLRDTVVWNPWIDKSRGMSDFDDEEYKLMVCVETGTVADYIPLSPGHNWQGSQILSVDI